MFILYFPEFIYSIHSIFYVSMLENITSNIFSRQFNLPSVLVTIDSEIEYEIVNHRSQMSLQVLLQSHLTRLWKYKRQIWVVTYYLTHLCSRTNIQLLCHIFFINFSLLPLSWSFILYYICFLSLFLFYLFSDCSYSYLYFQF